MQPKTKIQKFIVEQNKSVKPLTEIEKNWVKSLHSEIVTFSYKEFHHCMECNYKWRDNIMHTQVLKKTECPSCKTKLHVPKSWDRNNTLDESIYFHKIEVVNNIQIVRIFNSIKYFHRTRKPHYFINEVCQHWILENGTMHTLALKGGMDSGYYGDNWIFSSNLEFRSNTFSHYHRIDIPLTNLYPKKKFAKYIKKRGIKTSVYDLKPEVLLRDILVWNELETFLKIGEIGALKYFVKKGYSSIHTYWKSILICNKLGYNLKNTNDFSMWIDMLDLLIFFNKDIKSPKYICPDNLKQAHDKYVKKKKEHDWKQELQSLKKEIQQDQVIYKKTKKKFFSLKFTNGEIEIEPLKHVKEFYEEGKQMEHCLFTNRYHQKQNVLILSAKVNGQKMETIEVSLKNFEVVQSRGKNNVTTEYHSEIVDLVNKNMIKIKKAS